MDNLFSGLEELGLNNLSNISTYDEDEKNDVDDKRMVRMTHFLKRIFYLINHIHVQSDLFLNQRQLRLVG